MNDKIENLSLMGIYSLYDHAVKKFTPPFTNPNDATSIRGFSDAINDRQNQSDLSKHAEQFQLYKLGTFDPFTAEFDIYQTPEPLVSGLQVKDDIKVTEDQIEMILEELLNIKTMVKHNKH